MSVSLGMECVNVKPFLRQQVIYKRVEVCATKGGSIKLLYGIPECASLPLPGTGQREGLAFMEPFEQFGRMHFTYMHDDFCRCQFQVSSPFICETSKKWVWKKQKNADKGGKVLENLWTSYVNVPLDRSI